MSGVKISADGVIDILYRVGAPRKNKEGKPTQRVGHKYYDTKDPVEMSDLYRDVAEKPTRKGFEQEMISKYNNMEGLKDLNRPGMQKWVNWLLKTGPKYYDENQFKDMLITHVATTGLDNNANSMSSWMQFYLKNKDLIDIRRSKLRKNQQASTGPNMISTGAGLSGITLN